MLSTATTDSIMHTRTPQVLHRDFKPANILLDHSLHAYLGDTGFAKAAKQGRDASGKTAMLSTGKDLTLTSGFAEPLSTRERRSLGVGPIGGSVFGGTRLHASARVGQRRGYGVFRRVAAVAQLRPK